MPQKSYSRPADKSLEAYKRWIMDMASFLTGDEAMDDMTPAEWEKEWKEFWAEPIGKSETSTRRKTASAAKTHPRRTKTPARRNGNKPR